MPAVLPTQGICLLCQVCTIVVVLLAAVELSGGQSLALGRLNAGAPSIRSPDLQMKVPGGYASTSWEDEEQQPSEDRPIGVDDDVPLR